MLTPYFDLVSHWRLRATPEAVWEALTDSPNWPLWWPYVRKVEALAEKRRRVVWRTPLGYGFTLDVEVVESLPCQRLRIRSRGHMYGEGIWLFRRRGEHTDVTYVWRVTLPFGWMRWLAPLLAPVFRWNHATVMKAGAAGLAAYLGVRTARIAAPKSNALDKR